MTPIDDGSNRVMRWIFGVLCAGIVITLLYLAAPMGPPLVAFIGDSLRTVAP